RFLFNPLLVGIIGIYGTVSLLRRYRSAHPLDRNRVPFMLAAFCILSLTLLDYLPHFGIDLFGGPLSALTLPAASVLFGYACLRFRLALFRTFLGRVAGWSATLACVAVGYAIALEIAERLVVAKGTAHVAAAAVAVGMFAASSRAIPAWAER